jgi:hypothetical protein
MQYVNAFIELKQLTEDLWDKKELEKVYGYQFQPKTKWKDGLSVNELAGFEMAMGWKFPEILRDYYTIINGVDKESVNIYGNSGLSPTCMKMLYGYPEDVNLIRELTEFIYDENYIDTGTMKGQNVSRIFPVYAHWFILIDHPGHPILSMNGEDILYYSDNLLDLFYRDLAQRREWSKNKTSEYGWIDH